MSREIDARVAREVMGLETRETDKDAYAFFTCSEVVDINFGANRLLSPMPTDGGWLFLVPRYSTDMNAAMEVIEKIIGKHDSMKILILPGSNSDPRPWFEATVKIGIGVFPPVVSRNSLSEAICLAALEAVNHAKC